MGQDKETAFWKNGQIVILTARPETPDMPITRNMPGMSTIWGLWDARDSPGVRYISSGSALKFSASRRLLRSWVAVFTTAIA